MIYHVDYKLKHSLSPSFVTQMLPFGWLPKKETHVLVHQASLWWSVHNGSQIYYITSKMNTQHMRVQILRDSFTSHLELFKHLSMFVIVLFGQQSGFQLWLNLSRCPWAALNTKLQKSSTLANDTSTFLLEWVLLLWNAFDQRILFCSALYVLRNLFTAFGHLTEKSNWSDNQRKKMPIYALESHSGHPTLM